MKQLNKSVPQVTRLQHLTGVQVCLSGPEISHLSPKWSKLHEAKVVESALIGASNVIKHDLDACDARKPKDCVQVTTLSNSSMKVLRSRIYTVSPNPAPQAAIQAPHQTKALMMINLVKQKKHCRQPMTADGIWGPSNGAHLWQSCVL